MDRAATVGLITAAIALAGMIALVLMVTAVPVLPFTLYVHVGWILLFVTFVAALAVVHDHGLAKSKADR